MLCSSSSYIHTTAILEDSYSSLRYENELKEYFYDRFVNLLPLGWHVRMPRNEREAFYSQSRLQDSIWMPRQEEEERPWLRLEYKLSTLYAPQCFFFYFQYLITPYKFNLYWHHPFSRLFVVFFFHQNEYNSYGTKNSSVCNNEL